ncbi:hypothetical protein L596_020816 [Steinernema carpocapsae]|uniref:Uncharacterized protein n=1 Tax=Steinernema carpocapsae TaxID=34508 RepID=A0A4V6A114_STECR|nr:hypothetical protein L596_020816 [Steinernema carpocapsae]
MLLLNALDVFSPQLLLKVEEANFDNLTDRIKIKVPQTDEEKSLFAKKHKIKVLAQLTKQPLLSCVQVDAQLSSADAEYNDTCLLQGLEVNKKAVIDKLKKSLVVLRRCVTADFEERPTVDEKTEEILRSTAITPILSKKFPQAILHCAKCDQHFNSIPKAVNHAINFNEHKAHIKMEKSRIQLGSMPKPSQKHTEAILRAFEDCNLDLNAQNINTETLTSSLETILKTKFDDCQVLLHGSHLTKCFGENSDVNLTVIVSEDNLGNNVLEFLKEELGAIGESQMVTDRYTPFLEFEYSQKGTVKTQNFCQQQTRIPNRLPHKPLLLHPTRISSFSSDCSSVGRG